MSIASEHVAVFQGLWADRFVDEISVVRLGSRGAMNPSTLQYDSEAEPIVYSGEALIRSEKEEPAVTEFGQSSTRRVSAELFLPYDAAALRVEDTVTVTASASNTRLVGAIYRIVGVFEDTYNTKSRYVMERDLGAGEQS